MPCTGARITVLDENFVDILLPSTSRVQRYNMDQHFSGKYGEILAENGLSFLVETFHDDWTTTVLFDAGLTAEVVTHNARLLGIDLHDVDVVVLSHGHPDHIGGVDGVLEAIGHPVPVVVHPHAFDPRMIVKKHVTLPMINIGFTRAGIAAAGGHLVEASASLPLGPGIFTSGEMTTSVDFEYESPAGRLCVCTGGAVEVDEIDDHQVLGIDVEGHGLVVIDPCGHRGVLSAVAHMQKLSGTQRVHGVLGGFHTGHPGVSAERIERTADGLAGLDASVVAPMHCSGFLMKKAVATAAPDAFELLTAGSILTIGDVPPSTRRWR